MRRRIDVSVRIATRATSARHRLRPLASPCEWRSRELIPETRSNGSATSRSFADQASALVHRSFAHSAFPRRLTRVHSRLHDCPQLARHSRIDPTHGGDHGHVCNACVGVYRFAQFFLSRGMIYWTYPISATFGPLRLPQPLPFYAYLEAWPHGGIDVESVKKMNDVSPGKGIAGLFRSLTTRLGHVSAKPGQSSSSPRQRSWPSAFAQPVSRWDFDPRIASIFAAIVAMATVGLSGNGA